MRPSRTKSRTDDVIRRQEASAACRLSVEPGAKAAGSTGHLCLRKEGLAPSRALPMKEGQPLLRTSSRGKAKPLPHTLPSEKGDGSFTLLRKSILPSRIDAIVAAQAGKRPSGLVLAPSKWPLSDIAISIRWSSGVIAAQSRYPGNRRAAEAKARASDRTHPRTCSRQPSPISRLNLGPAPVLRGSTLIGSATPACGRAASPAR